MNGLVLIQVIRPRTQSVASVLTLVSIYLIFFAASALSAPLPPLRAGMEPRDVVKLWGPPKETMEYETKREELWIYESSEVRMQGGKVYSWKAKGVGGGEFGPDADVYPVDGLTGKGTEEDVQVPVSDILSEIMQEGSGEEDDEAKRNRRRRR